MSIPLDMRSEQISLKFGQYIGLDIENVLDLQMNLLSLEFLQYVSALISRKITRI
jgi:hypothetical protein